MSRGWRRPGTGFVLLNIYVSAASGLNCDLRDGLLQCMDSLAVVRRLSSSEVGGILVPRPGTDLTFPALQGRFLTTGPPGKSPRTGL